MLPGARPWQGAGTKQVAGVISEEEWRGAGGDTSLHFLSCSPTHCLSHKNDSFPMSGFLYSVTLQNSLRTLRAHSGVWNEGEGPAVPARDSGTGSCWHWALMLRERKMAFCWARRDVLGHREGPRVRWLQGPPAPWAFPQLQTYQAKGPELRRFLRACSVEGTGWQLFVPRC